MSLYENVQALRKKPETARVGTRYSKEDDENIMKQAAEGIPVTEIAASQKRTVKAVKHRIAMLAVKEMKGRGLTLKEISRMYHINMVLLSHVYQRECERDQYVTNMMRSLH